MFILPLHETDSLGYLFRFAAHAECNIISDEITLNATLWSFSCRLWNHLYSNASTYQSTRKEESRPASDNAAIKSKPDNDKRTDAGKSKKKPADGQGEKPGIGRGERQSTERKPSHGDEKDGARHQREAYNDSTMEPRDARRREASHGDRVGRTGFNGERDDRVIAKQRSLSFGKSKDSEEDNEGIRQRDKDREKGRRSDRDRDWNRDREKEGGRDRDREGDWGREGGTSSKLRRGHSLMSEVQPVHHYDDDDNDGGHPTSRLPANREEALKERRARQPLREDEKGRMKRLFGVVGGQGEGRAGGTVQERRREGGIESGGFEENSQPREAAGRQGTVKGRILDVRGERGDGDTGEKRGRVAAAEEEDGRAEAAAAGGVELRPARDPGSLPQPQARKRVAEVLSATWAVGCRAHLWNRPGNHPSCVGDLWTTIRRLWTLPPLMSHELPSA